MKIWKVWRFRFSSGLPVKLVDMTKRISFALNMSAFHSFRDMVSLITTNIIVVQICALLVERNQTDRISTNDVIKYRTSLNLHSEENSVKDT